MNRIQTSGLFLAGVLSLASCSSAADPEKAQAPAPATTAAKAKTPYVPVDACTLLTKAEVEALAGKAVMEPRKEELAELVTCSFGDPTAPQVAGRALSQVLTLSVFTGEEGAYYAGPAAQAKDSFTTGRKNAASVEAVSGLGEDAYWDKVLHTLSAVKGKYLVSADIGVEGDRLKLAKAAVAKALDRLPRE